MDLSFSYPREEKVWGFLYFKRTRRPRRMDIHTSKVYPLDMEIVRGGSLRENLSYILIE